MLVVDKSMCMCGGGCVSVFLTKSVLVFRYRVIHMYILSATLSLSLSLSLSLALRIQEYNKKFYFSDKRQERKWKKGINIQQKKKKLQFKTSDNSNIEC